MYLKECTWSAKLLSSITNKTVWVTKLPNKIYQSKNRGKPRGRSDDNEGRLEKWIKRNRRNKDEELFEKI